MASFTLKCSFSSKATNHVSSARPLRVTSRNGPLKFNRVVRSSFGARPVLLSASLDDKDTPVEEELPMASVAEEVEGIDIEVSPSSQSKASQDNDEDVWNSTYYPKLADASMPSKKWYIVDAEDQTLGRLATKIARVIRGKENPRYHPAMDMGDIVIVINAEKVKVGGNKFNTKLYRRHSGRPGGMKIETFKDLQARIPERIIEKAVWGMLPKNRLGRRIFHHMKVYKGPDHPHEAQKPEVLSLDKYPNTKLEELQKRLEEEKSLAAK